MVRLIVLVAVDLVERTILRQDAITMRSAVAAEAAEAASGSVIPLIEGEEEEEDEQGVAEAFPDPLRLLVGAVEEVEEEGEVGASLDHHRLAGEVNEVETVVNLGTILLDCKTFL